jgi:hypothetical protein
MLTYFIWVIIVAIILVLVDLKYHEPILLLLDLVSAFVFPLTLLIRLLAMIVYYGDETEWHD